MSMQPFKTSLQKFWYIYTITVLISVFGVYCWFAPPEKSSWTGFKKDTEESRTEKILENGKEITVVTKYVSGKTLWDWLSLTGVPLSLAGFGWLQQRRSNKQAALEKEIAESNQKEEVLQAYFDRLSTLLVDKNLIAIAAKFNEGSDTSNEEKDLLSASTDIIRARTLSILRRLGEDGERKFSVMQFLIEAGVVSQLNLDISGADLRSAKLSRAILRDVKLSSAILIATDLKYANLDCADLSGADLSGADLSNAYLRSAKLMGANLSNAKLNGANLVDATLRNANLSGANLSNANLIGAYLLNTNLSSVNLSDANLSDANLIGATLLNATLLNTNLSGADLSHTNLSSANLNGAQGFTLEQAVSAKLCQTKLPPNIQIDPNRDCEELGFNSN